MLKLEALRARHGDSLLLHYGPADDPSLVLIDGGPPGVYRQSLGPRLRALREERALASDDPLEIPLAMVSHMDSDHIKGILDLSDELIECLDDGVPPPYGIRRLWFNAFDDIVSDADPALFQAAWAAVGAASVAGDVPDEVRREHPGAAILASVPQGRALRDNAARLALEVNEEEGSPLLRPPHAPGPTRALGHGLSLRVLGPSERRVEALQKEWDKQIQERGLADEATAAAFVDSSVFNLASIVALAESEGKKLLLTGDARGDDILEALEETGALGEEPFRVDLLKLPHHGSERNVTTDFFRSVPADHYVVSADGRYGNPELTTLEMIIEAREAEEFVFYFTYPFEEMEQGPAIQDLFGRALRDGARFEVRTPDPGETSVTVDLSE